MVRLHSKQNSYAKMTRQAIHLFRRLHCKQISYGEVTRQTRQLCWGSQQTNPPTCSACASGSLDVCVLVRFHQIGSVEAHQRLNLESHHASLPQIRAVEHSLAKLCWLLSRGFGSTAHQCHVSRSSFAPPGHASMHWPVNEVLHPHHKDKVNQTYKSTPENTLCNISS